MIKDIKELNFPEYATITSASCVMQDMGEKTITTTIKIDGDISPDFSYDWEVIFKGSKYVMPLRRPQGNKGNESVMAEVELTFTHWAIREMKRWYFFTVSEVETGVVMPERYEASVSVALDDFCIILGKALDYYTHGKMSVSLNPSWVGSREAQVVEISNSTIWDVVEKIYDLYAVRWSIEPVGADGERYELRIGWEEREIDHIWEYGYKGGLLRVERQVQDDSIRNMLMGRGGEKNLPFRYFKDKDAGNPSFNADPDWVQELASMSFDALRGATFRSYVQGWKRKHYPSNYADNREKAYDKEAWNAGYNDESWNGREWVKDADSVEKYGEYMGMLENNEDIYPTIQGVEVDGLGRIDEAVAVSEIFSDDVEQASESEAQIMDVEGAWSDVVLMEDEAVGEIAIIGVEMEIPEGETGDFDDAGLTLRYAPVIALPSMSGLNWEKVGTMRDAKERVELIRKDVRVVNAETGEERSASGIPAGKWVYKITAKVRNKVGHRAYVEVSCGAPKLTIGEQANRWQGTWEVWIKNVWGSTKQSFETAEAYAQRVWEPILGDHEGNEAKVAFSDGALAASEDYEFVIVKTPEYDVRECEWQTIEGSEVVTHSFMSEWKLTLAKSDADLESTGKYVPSVQRQAKAGDHFAFLGIDLPHRYVELAERRLDDWKKDQLKETAKEKLTWVVRLDKVRLNDRLEGESQTLMSQIKEGRSLRLADKRFVTDKAYELLNIKSITYTYNEPASEDAALEPDVEVTLGNDYEAVANPVSVISGEVSAISKQIGALSNIEQVVRAVGDRLYLRKDGVSDRSVSRTEMAAMLTSGGFSAGLKGGSGWGFFKDASGRWTLETDRVNVRDMMQVNSLVVNQISARGGMSVESAAAMEIKTVIRNVDGGYMCYFDTKDGSVANLFRLDDVAMCNRFDAENLTLKYYKRRVVGIGSDYVVLGDEDVDGEGTPESGDVIVQYGNYTDASRQYVIVRDVIGGGYERMIEGLNSVRSAGQEYYFAGRQEGMYNGRPRWYVGSGDSNIEFKEGKLSLKNVSLSVGTTIGDKTIGEYIKGESNVSVGAVNMVADSDVAKMAKGAVDTTEAKYALDEKMLGGGEYTVSVWTQNELKAGSVSVRLMWKGEQTQNVTLEKRGAREWGATFRCSLDSDEIRIVRISRSGAMIAKVKVERGNTATDWSPSPKDVERAAATMDYIKLALKESTVVDGGLIVSSLLKLGYTEGNAFKVMSGLSGLYAKNNKGGGISYWAGGEMKDGGDDGAQMVVRMDGTGYMSGGTVRFSKGRLELGDALSLESGELRMRTGNGGLSLIIRDGSTGWKSTEGLACESQIKESIYCEANMAHYSNISQGSFFSVYFDQREFNIGQWGSGAKITLNVKSTLRREMSDPSGHNAQNNYGKVSVYLVDSEGAVTLMGEGMWGAPTKVGTESAFGRDIYEWKLDVAITDYAITQTGEYRIAIAGADTKAGGDNALSGVTDADVTLSVSGSVNGSEARMMVIGNDGIAANWGKSLFCVDEDGVAMRYGDSYIKIDKNGIKAGDASGEREL